MTTDEIMALADHVVVVALESTQGLMDETLSKTSAESRCVEARAALRAAVERLVRENETSVHALTEAVLKETNRAERAERLLRSIFIGLSDHDQAYWMEELPELAAAMSKEGK